MNTSDITIICPNGRQLLCHRAVLSSRSKRLAAVFQSGEYQGQHLPVSGVDSSALESVISSFYTGECPVSLDTVCAVHDAATKLEVTDLLQSCMGYLQQMISLDNCCTLLSVALQLKNVPIMDFCRQYIYARFTELVSSPDYWKQPLDVVASILADSLGINRPMPQVINVAGAWLLRQHARDSLKMQLLNAIGATQYLGMLDDYLQRNMSQGGALNLGAADAMQRGMGMQSGMMQPMDSSSMMMMGGGMMPPGQGMPGMMPPGQNGMYPGMVPQHMMVPMDGTQQGMYGMAPGMGDMQHAGGYGQPGMMGQDMSMMGGNMGMQAQNSMPRSSDRQQREVDAGRHNQRGTPGRNMASPGGRGKGGRGGRGRGRGGRGAGNNANGELPSEEDQSDATRSMPANEQNSDGEPNSQATSTDQAAKKGAPGSAGKGAQGGDGTPTHRRSYYGNGLDGVLALAEAAEAAEQKQKGTPAGKGTPVKAEAKKAEEESKGEEGEGLAKRKAPEGEGSGKGEEGKDVEPGTTSKRAKTGDKEESGEVKEGSQGEGAKDDAVKPEGEGGELPNLDFVNQVISSASQALASGQQLVGSSQLPLPSMAAGGGLLPLPNNPNAALPGVPPGITWDPSQNALPGTGLSPGLPGFDPNNPTAALLASLTAAANAGTNGGFDAATAAAMNGGLSNSLLESVTNAAGGNRPDVSPAAALQQLVSGIVERNTGPRQDPRLIGLPAPPPREDGRGRGKGSRSMQPVKGFCHVENCGADLTGLRDYHQRYKICDYHLKAPAIMRDGVQQRFCQQCGRFHMLDAFDGTRRSCRAMLQRHNARRNKRNPDALGLPPPPNDSSRNPAYLQSLHALQALAAKPNTDQSQADLDAQMQAAAAAATAAAAVAAASGLPPGLAQFPPNLLAGGLAGGLNAALLNPLLGMTGGMPNMGNPGGADGNNNPWNLLSNAGNLGAPATEQQTAEQQQAQQQVKDLLAQAMAQQQQVEAPPADGAAAEAPKLEGAAEAAVTASAS